jgi:hypothetical protein
MIPSGVPCRETMGAFKSKAFAYGPDLAVK